jgi:hypothetical protein
MDVSDEESDQELSILTPPDIINEAKTADMQPEKSNPLYRIRNTMICLCNGTRKTEQ